MGLVHQLERGELGVRCRLGAAQVLEQSERSARLVVPAQQVSLELVHELRHLAELDPTTWRVALEREANLTGTPPIEFEKLDVGAEARWLLLRRSYAPGDELVEGLLWVPTATGLLTVSLRARDQVTGYREATLALRYELPSTHARSAPLTQAFFDSPQHDHEFPEHCLSRVRRTRQWLLAGAGGALACTEATGPSSQKRVLEASARRAGGEARPGTRGFRKS
jgi:hypothetical protein